MGFFDTLRDGIAGRHDDATRSAQETVAAARSSAMPPTVSGPAPFWGAARPAAVIAAQPQWIVEPSADRTALGPAAPDRAPGQTAAAEPSGSSAPRYRTRPVDGGAPPGPEPLPVADHPEPSAGEKIAAAIGAGTQAFLGRFNGAAVPERQGAGAFNVVAGPSLWESAKPWIAAAAVLTGVVLVFRAAR